MPEKPYDVCLQSLQRSQFRKGEWSTILDKANVNQVVKLVMITSDYPSLPGDTNVITPRTIINIRICRQWLGNKAQVLRDKTNPVSAITLLDIM